MATPEDYGIVTIHPRVSVTKHKAVAIFDRCKGKCLICGLKIHAPKEKWHVAHKKARAMGGSNTDENLFVAHDHCNLREDYEEVIPQVSQAKRRRAAHLGAENACGKKPKRKLQGRGFPKDGDGEYKQPSYWK